MPNLPVQEIWLPTLRPTQGSVLFYRDTGVNWDDPIETLLYEGEPDNPEALLILDGHHRSYRANILGKTSVNGYVLYEDEHVASSRASSILGMETVEEVRATFRYIWSRELEKAGVISVDTLPAAGVDFDLTVTVNPELAWFEQTAVRLS